MALLFKNLICFVFNFLILDKSSDCLLIAWEERVDSRSLLLRFSNYRVHGWSHKVLLGDGCWGRLGEYWSSSSHQPIPNAWILTFAIHSIALYLSHTFICGFIQWWSDYRCLLLFYFITHSRIFTRVCSVSRFFWNRWNGQGLELFNLLFRRFFLLPFRFSFHWWLNRLKILWIFCFISWYGVFGCELFFNRLNLTFATLDAFLNALINFWTEGL
mgnify:CR=1 FL=1